MTRSLTDKWRVSLTLRLGLLSVLCSCLCTGRALDVTSKCYAECDSRLVVEQENFNVICSEDCRLEKCRDGCDRWHSSMSSSCQDICNGTVPFHGKDVFCLMGCNLAIAVYLESIKTEIGEPAAPYLVADTATHRAVTIRWSLSPLKNVSYLVQWRYDSLPGEWEYYDPQLPLHTSSLQVDGLRPYTKYRFRVAWILLPNHSPLFSAQSVVIPTLPRGVPSTAPRITSLTATSPSSIAVSWDPPAFPNGPILSYALYLVEHPGGFTMVKDISDVSMGLYFMFSGLRPDTLYTVSVATNNNVGMGPNVTMNVTTPTDANSTGSPSPEPSLVIATKSQVLTQDISIMDVPTPVYTTITSSEITGVAIHIASDELFIADSAGSVHSITVKGSYKRRTLVEHSPNRPGILSIDWLNEKLYIVEDGQISACDLSGSGYEVAVSGFEERPSEMQVDPYNGYMYWVLQNATTGGLYRIDLSKIGKETVARQEAQLLIKDEDLRTFAVDYRNYRLLLPKKKQNTVVSVSLSGTDESDIRRNSQKRQFTDVRRMAYYVNTLFWTTISQVFREEYHREGDKFYHTAYTMDEHCVYIGIFHSSAQLCPVPVNPVRAVQAIFKDDLAKIAWRSPRLLGGLGEGTWQKWLYELQVQDHSTRNILFRANITDTSATVSNLRPNTVYSVRVRAYSRGGKGPWSSDFVGRTLQTTRSPGYPYMLWSANEALLKSDIVGDGVQPLIHWSTFENAHITDISWYQGQLFLNTNTSMVYTYNMSSHYSLQRLQNVSHATAIAVDWLAPKLYWSSPIRQMVLRSNLDGTYPESLPLLTLAQELAIDAPSGVLYWATTHSVECARLNGEDRQAFFQAGLFSGKHVMGLTLDLTHEKVYWMVRSFQGSNLFKASLRKHGSYVSDPTEELIGPLPETDMKGPIWYFSNRLYWIHQEREASISNMLGQNVATLKGIGLHGLAALAVVDPSLQPYPGGMKPSSIKVVPGTIPGNRLRVIGTWENFTITWPMERGVNYGKVFYELKITDGRGGTYTQVTEENQFVYPTTHHLQPYTLLDVAVRAYTYWASSRPTSAVVFSPMSVPTAPLQPRVFCSHSASPLEADVLVKAELRWAPPRHPNGIVKSYRIDCWYFSGKHKVTTCRSTRVGGRSLSYHLKELLPNTTYYFRVGAATEAGEGPMSNIVQVSTSDERPVPRLLLAKMDAVKLLDVDCHEEMLLSSKASRPIAVAYLAQDGRVFWLEEKGLLVASALDGSNTTVIHSLPFAGTSLAVDWVGRYLYWTETDTSARKSAIVVMDLNQGHSYSVALNSSMPIMSVEVDPFSSTLLYTSTTSHGYGILMMCGTDGSNPQPFFGRHSRRAARQSRRRRSSRHHEEDGSCNCDPHVAVGHALALDRSVRADPRVLWVDGESGHIWAADMEGCRCSLIINATEMQNAGLPPASLTADKSHIYWSNFTTGKIYSVEKAAYSVVTDISPGRGTAPSHITRRFASEDVQGVRRITAIGEHLQSYPDAACLLPPQTTTVPVLKLSTSRELVIQLAEPAIPVKCTNISKASVKYTLFYGAISPDNTWQCKEDLRGCSTVVTYNTTVTLRDLRPFTNYSVKVAVSNFYSAGMSSPGSFAIFMTHEGVPSAPRRVKVEVVSPTTIYVAWNSPETPNGHPISYEIRWCQSEVWSRWHSTSYVPNAEEKNRSSYELFLHEMAPSTEYHILVRAYSRGGDKHSDSEPISTTTYELPRNLTMSRVTSHEIDVIWTAPGTTSILSHKLHYRKAGAHNWRHLTSEPTEPNRTYIYPLRNLAPKAEYSLRMVVIYRSSFNATFAWPRLGHFTFHTLGDKPDMAKSPNIINLGGDIYQVEWEEVSRNGGEFLLYILQVKTVNTVSDHSEDGTAQSIRKESEWNTAYNSSNNYWIIRNLEPHSQYIFRVKAMNEYGEGNFSDPSELFVLPDPGAIIDAERDPIRGVITFIILGVLLFASAALVSVYLVHKRREKDKKDLQDNGQEIRADLELATLSELPHHGNFIQQNNALYALGDLPSDEVLASLPLIERDQIILTKFLGSGAFGEVFEGIAHDLGGEGQPPTKVAVKTLRKGATEQEKAEFLKEAKLMSNFKHDHILRLLGISLDTSLHFIILELMEGGDLLSYLRNNRPTATEPSPLTLGDLLSICVDVATGCRYLEDMHFVHRDLAARNCLVSSTDPQTRIVKIGDFGLARDIYKHDYYRKEGEGLLPVRWMAPESLVDGVFTNHSDVWAFGVLLWEVMTLGQQPYPARTNLEVLHYVREGGRLDNPECCPDDLHELMLRCWSYNPEERPDFAFCLEALQSLRQKYLSLSNILTAVHNHNYIGQTFTGTSKECGEQRQDSLLSSQEDYSLRSGSDSTATLGQIGDLPNDPRIQSPNGPVRRTSLPSYHSRNIWNNSGTNNSSRYLQLLCDTEAAVDADGYEIPLPLPPPHVQQQRPLLCADPPGVPRKQMYAHIFSCNAPKAVSLDGGNLTKERTGSNKVETAPDGRLSPTVTSALLKTPAEELDRYDPIQTLREIFTRGGQKDKQIDGWSFSTSSTAPCTPCTSGEDSSASSHRNSGISSLSAVSGTELDCVPKVSWC